MCACVSSCVCKLVGRGMKIFSTINNNGKKTKHFLHVFGIMDVDYNIYIRIGKSDVGKRVF